MPRSPPVVAVNTPDTKQTTTTVKITPPVSGGPFDKFVVAVCPAGTNPNWASCPLFECSPAQIAACPITGLTPATDYQVSVVAVAGAQISQRSNIAPFTTLPWP